MICVAKTLSSRLIRRLLKRSPRLYSNFHQMHIRVKGWACVTPFRIKSLTGKFKSQAICLTVWSLSTRSRSLGPKSILSWNNAPFKIVTPRLGLSAILKRTWFIASIQTCVTTWRKILRALKSGSSHRMAARLEESFKRTRELGHRSSRWRKVVSKSHLRKFWLIPLQFNKLLPCEQFK